MAGNSSVAGELALSADADPVVAAAGPVGAHVRISAGPLRLEAADSDLILAEADLLGEAGTRDGAMGDFRRGVTRYPVPDAKVHPATSADLTALFAADDLALPYWLMNFEEHAEVLVTTRGAERRRDCDMLARCLPDGARGFMDVLPALRNRECVTSGEGVAIPVRLALDTLEPARRPASRDPVFSTLWREQAGDAAMPDRTIRRWRGRGKEAALRLPCLVKGGEEVSPHPSDIPALALPRRLAISCDPT